MTDRNILTAIVIAKNEAPRIARCLDALSFADTVLVMDNNSTDGTQEIARKHHATVVSVDTADFSTLRNLAMQHASSEWVLYVDADEVVSRDLGVTIRHTLAQQDPSVSGYELCRKNLYLGYPWPTTEWMLRLFRKKALSKWQGAIHETPIIDGRVSRLSGCLIHDTHRTIAEMVEKTNEWSETEARLRLEAHHPPITWWRLIRVFLTGFWTSFFRQGGWRAGTVGWIESLYQGFSLFVTYAKLWEMQGKKIGATP